MTYRVVTRLAPGDRGTDQILQAMGVFARQAAASSPYGEKLWWNEEPARRIDMLRAFLARKVRYEDDPPGMELVRHPMAMLDDIGRQGFACGDCDDVATLAAALALAMGLRARFRVVAFDADGNYSHVWTEVHAGRGEAGWRELDTTRPQALPPGLRVMRSATLEV